MTVQARPKHGAFGVLLGLVAIVVPGCVAIVVAALRDVPFPAWLSYRLPFMGGGSRALSLAGGVALLVVARGYFAFWRFGWLGYVVWAVIVALAFLISLSVQPILAPIEALPLVVILGLPYLWFKRSDYGIGPRPHAGGL